MKRKGTAILLIMLSVVAMLSTAIFATTIPTPRANPPGAGAINTAVGNILGILQIVGMAAAVIILIWLGIKYMSAAPSEKADIKKSMVIWIVGAVLLFAASGILSLVRSFGNQVNTDLQIGNTLEVE